MKKSKSLFVILLIAVMFIALTLTSCESSANEPQEKKIRELSKTEEQVVSSSVQFGIDLLKELVKEKGKENVIISPLSVSTAFGMALNGAENETYNQMQSVLGLSAISLNEINESYLSVNDMLTGVDNKVKFSSANSIWYRNGFAVENNFIEVNKKYFDAEVTEANFDDPSTVNRINDWVKEATNSKIDKIIEQIDGDKVMYLINAIYFKGIWKYQFEASNTLDDTFNSGSGTLPVKMMNQKNKFRYMINSELQAVELPYGNDLFEMMILLPNQGEEINNFIQNFSVEKFNNIKANFSETELTLSLPRFKVADESTLNTPLKNLGMIDAFSENIADFSKITKADQIFISEVKHKTFVEVNEEGTEAAAVTSIGISTTSVRDEIFLRVDRQFLFVIYEKNTNTILFLGKVVKPE